MLVCVVELVLELSLGVLVDIVVSVDDVLDVGSVDDGLDVELELVDDGLLMVEFGIVVVGDVGDVCEPGVEPGMEPGEDGEV